MSKKDPSQRPPNDSGPFIPENVLDAPSQRLYYLSLGLLCQAIKLFDFFQYLFLGEGSSSSFYTRKWILVDSVYIFTLAALRIPRLRYPRPVVILQIVSICLLDAFLFGSLTVNLGIAGTWKVAPGVGLPGRGALPSTGQAFHFSDLVPAFIFGGIIGSGGKDPHLRGQHTVRMSPISTAQLNPNLQTFCIASPGQNILIPVLLNNTNPVNLQYSLTPLGYGAEASEKEKSKSGAVGKVERVDLSAKEIKAIEQSRLETLQVAKVASTVKRNTDDYDEYDDEDEEEPTPSHGTVLQRTQSIVHIRLNKPGVLRLERVLDSSNIEARLIPPTELTVAPCPRAEFSPDSALSPTNLRCASSMLYAGGGEEIPLNINIYGVPPLSLRWQKDVNGKKEPFMVEGIESDSYSKAHSHSQDEGRRVANAGLRAPEQFSVPLTMTLDALGTHSYVLESVTDALGNTMPAGSPNDISKTIRSTTVLRRPAVSFKGCGPGNPTSLLIGSETSLTISAKDSDPGDAPWDVTVRYHPTESEEGSRKKLKPWTQKFTTEDERRELQIQASAPGEYAILGINGRYCEGDVLSPETCKVVEKPLPAAEIEWKKIHECSGDIGVSASLVLHGTPPFQVYYRMKRDNEPAKELVKTFTTSRGELTIQPDRSGHYVFSFFALSDANYKKVALKGPSIDQVVHPPASADFAHDANSRTVSRNRRKINSCSGNTVDVNVEIRGTGPWNLDVQIVAPKGSEIVHVKNITTPKKTIQVPIPPTVDRDGGTFEIDLVSVEDAYGCKRPISVSGITVNVRRLKPTVKFYSPKDKRHITILEGETASLPLRLTGDKPWKLKYRRAEDPGYVKTATLRNPNDELRVSQKGLYEIVEVADSQCPGEVVTEASTYQVDWIPRPVARLSSDIQATYEPHNGSHILPPICEGLPDHVDLDLTGKPPFQIMYNIARDADGATKIIDQPVFNSIQPRTRFELHTTEAARFYYEVKQIGDAWYPLAKNKNAVIPRSQRLLFEQQVLRRPSARFKNNQRLSYCFNDALVPRDGGSDGVIVLEGTPPFQLEVSIWNRAARETYKETVELHDNVWKLNVPSYTFKSIGPHLVSIESVQDASNCAQTALDPLFKSVWVDVAETAAIVPFDRREHYCVGDVTQFQLEGTPPWTIEYRVNGRSHVQEVKTSPFAIAQDQAGEFAITSIAHQRNMCQTAVTDLLYTVHSLPAAQVGHGKRIIQDIHEGDQAEIVFTLVGEPPFTFTYQRTELTTKKGAQGKVLETHTVSGITTQEYSIFSSQEGTWTVTFISDRYCRYPPAPDGSIEKSR